MIYHFIVLIKTRQKKKKEKEKNQLRRCFFDLLYTLDEQIYGSRIGSKDRSSSSQLDNIT